eukprot:COSAG02_NODE_17748_length_984_cov_0.838418_2_plen_46_part_00
MALVVAMAVAMAVAVAVVWVWVRAVMEVLEVAAVMAGADARGSPK